ncbi:MAG TPA: hypothetical protein VFO98_07510 [Marmoricola sp.]|jgi:hypothetical protein|nr:hypothetical protein [Marmoricola sp.]
MAARDRVSLTEGYGGAQQKNNAIGDEGGNSAGMSKKQHGHTEAFLAANKGGLATQGGNGSTATANSIAAGANLHNTNADNSTRFLKQTAAHEESGAHAQAGESRGVETAAMDLQSKINRA